MPEIPIDLFMFEILPNLTARDVGRYKLVCKEWCSFLSTVFFARLHCRQMPSLTKMQFVLITGGIHRPLRTLSYGLANISLTEIVKMPFKTRAEYMMILGSLHGMLCVCLSNTCQLLIWNPLTNAYRNLSIPKKYGFFKVNFDAVGFYVDYLKDYNLLHVVFRRNNQSVYIYSMESQCWRQIKFVKDFILDDQTVQWSCGTLCCNGLYFTVGSCWDYNVALIVRFDMNLETFTKVSFPFDEYEVNFRGSLVNVSDELHFFVLHGAFDVSVDLWKLKGEEWIRILSVPDIDCIPLLIKCFVRYIGSSKKWLLMTDYGDVYEFDLDVRKVDNFYPIINFYALKGAVYSESLMSPNV
ncbi:putative galactose oxidase/kelch, beta-propeller, F-box associated interaction [Helianthus annuus]|uniref:Galactose oxidase/kelch, beta-propeller, F-box associated interaction n=1 Tax=Helianthus annuus TaxID=4232 RepID=A0A251VNQ4_HELAN|nr:F-box/kelch-repeat protein At3g23880-like [Helianthus annuus]KAF5801981.1 putative galactose oxidase/kelch, beta-propeller, F-box associated interaction [Helianthus annuus]KAJ0560207.1 putative galactose oxidase/kelch, beta-propeller, F-box associated interaction [Helianthus annuus]KAJ0566460.1 putative galactose oxidase/kelch, beta-propeller, F-box associated interaction [Helianthus annuus]KAJ0573209.1 putative galactose oxidase/kelch, beta-propeller, F-box associated interaction [Helianthu